MPVRTLTIVVTGDSSAYERAMARGEASTKKFETAQQAAAARMKKTGESMQRTGRSLTRWVTLPVVAVGAAAVKMSLDFHKSMQLVSTQAGGSEKEVKRLTKQMLELGAKGRYAAGPQELTEALFHIESVGIRGAKAMKTLAAADDLAAVGHADLEQTTNALVGAMRTGIKGADNMREAIGLMNAIIGAGNLRMDELTAAIGTGFLVAAKQVGLSFRDAGAALAEMTSQGVPATQTATRLRMTFTLMAAPTDKAKEALKGIGLSAESLAKEMHKPAGLLKALTLLKEHMAGMTEIEQTQLLAKAFGGARSGTTIMALLGKLDDLKTKFVEIGDNAGKFNQKLRETKSDPADKLARAWSALRFELIKLGDVLLPKVLPLVQSIAAAVNGLLDGFASLPKLTQDWILKLTLAAVVLGPLLKAMGGLLKIYAGLKGASFLGGGAAAGGGAVGGAGAAGAAGAAGFSLGKLILPVTLVIGEIKAGQLERKVGGDSTPAKIIEGILNPVAAVASDIPHRFEAAMGLEDKAIAGRMRSEMVTNIRFAASAFKSGLLELRQGAKMTWNEIHEIFKRNQEAIVQITNKGSRAAKQATVNNMEAEIAAIKRGIREGTIARQEGLNAIRKISRAEERVMGGTTHELIHDAKLLKFSFGQTMTSLNTAVGQSLQSLEQQILHSFRKFAYSTSSNAVVGGTFHPLHGGFKPIEGRVRGGHINEPTFIVGEEAPSHPEWVIATNPAYKRDNVRYWLQAGHDLGIPGFAKGGLYEPRLVGPSGQLKAIGQGGIHLVFQGGQKFIAANMPTAGLNVPTGPVVQMAKAMVAAVWGKSQWPAFNALEMSEAGWNVHATNPSSGAYGLPQALPPSKLPLGAGPGSQLPLLEQAKLQLQWMVQYIKERYGTPSAAWDFHKAHNYYAKGGKILGDQTSPLAKALRNVARIIWTQAAPFYGKPRRSKMPAEVWLGTKGWMRAHGDTAVTFNRRDIVVAPDIARGIVGLGSPSGKATLLHEWTHSLQHPGLKLWESEGGAEDLKRYIAKSLWGPGPWGSRTALYESYAQKVLAKKGWPWIKRGQFRAKGGRVVVGSADMSVGKEPQILGDLRVLSSRLGKTVYVISGYRTPAHSVEVGGYADDPHTRGEAADIGIGGTSRASMASVSESILNSVNLYRPFGGASEINHVQLWRGGTGKSATTKVKAIQKISKGHIVELPPLRPTALLPSAKALPSATRRMLRAPGLTYSGKVGISELALGQAETSLANAQRQAEGLRTKAGKLRESGDIGGAEQLEAQATALEAGPKSEQAAVFHFQEELFKRNKHRIQKAIAKIDLALRKKGMAPKQRARLLGKRTALEEQLRSAEGGIQQAREGLKGEPPEEGEPEETPAQQAAREAIEAETKAAEELKTAIDEQKAAQKALEEEMVKQRQWAESEASLSGTVALRAFADFLSGYLGPKTFRQAQVAGNGSVGSY